MDGGRFDAAARRLATGMGTRRGVLTGLAAVAAALTGARGGGGHVAAATIACQPTNRVRLRCEEITQYASVCGVIDPVTGEHTKDWGITHSDLHDPPFVEEAWSAQGQPVAEVGCSCVGGGTDYCTRAKVTGFWTWTLAPQSAHLAFDLVGDYCCEDDCQAAWDAYSRVIARHEAKHNGDLVTNIKTVNERFRKGLEIDGCGATPEESRQAYETRRDTWLSDLRYDVLNSPHTNDPAPPNCKSKCAPKEPCKECKEGRCVPKACGKGKACCEETGKCGPAKEPCRPCPKGRVRCGSTCCTKGQGCCAKTGRCGPKANPCQVCPADRRGVGADAVDPDRWCAFPWWEGTIASTKSLHTTTSFRTHAIEASMTASFRVPLRPHVDPQHPDACDRFDVYFPAASYMPGATGRQVSEWHERDDWSGAVTTRDGREVQEGADWIALPHGGFFFSAQAGTYLFQFSPTSMPITEVSDEGTRGAVANFPSFSNMAPQPLPAAGVRLEGSVEQTGRDGATERLTWSLTGVCG